MLIDFYNEIFFVLQNYILLFFVQGILQPSIVPVPPKKKKTKGKGMKEATSETQSSQSPVSWELSERLSPKTVAKGYNLRESYEAERYDFRELCPNHDRKTPAFPNVHTQFLTVTPDVFLH